MSHWKEVATTSTVIADEMIAATDRMVGVTDQTNTQAGQLLALLETVVTVLQRGETVSPDDLEAMRRGLPAVRANLEKLTSGTDAIRDGLARCRHLLVTLPRH